MAILSYSGPYAACRANGKVPNTRVPVQDFLYSFQLAWLIGMMPLAKSSQLRPGIATILCDLYVFLSLSYSLILQKVFGHY